MKVLIVNESDNIKVIATPGVDIALIDAFNQPEEEFEANVALIDSAEWRAALGAGNINEVLSQL